MIQVPQLYAVLLALGVVAEDQVVALQPFHLLQMLAVEVVVHLGRPTIREGSFLVRLSLVPDAAGALRASHKKGEGIRSGRLLCHRGFGLRPLPDATLFSRSRAWAERDHELTCPDAPLEEVFVTQVVWLMTEELG